MSDRRFSLDDLIVEIVTNWAHVDEVKIGLWVEEEYEDVMGDVQHLDTFYAEAWGKDKKGTTPIEICAAIGTDTIYDALLELYNNLEGES